MALKTLPDMLQFPAAGENRRFLPAWVQYLSSLDGIARLFSKNTLSAPLINAANDAAAATAGVPVQGLYRNGNAVQIRLT